MLRFSISFLFKLNLPYNDKKAFTREGLRTEMKEGFPVFGSAWNYSDDIEDLKDHLYHLVTADEALLGALVECLTCDQ